MGRFIGFVATSALAAVLAPVIAFAASSTFAPVPDLRSALLLQFFGEVSDASASLSISNGATASDSLLRDAAFRVSIAFPSSAAPKFSVGAAAVDEIHPSTASVTALDSVTLRPPGKVIVAGQTTTPGLVIANYQPPSTGTLSTGNDAVANAFSFGGSTPSGSASYGLGTQNVSFDHTGTIRLGRLHLETRFDVDTGISSDLEHLVYDGSQQSTLLPAYAGVSRDSIGAAFALPVARGLMLGLGYNAQHLLGGYATPGVDSFDASSNTYSGKLTFAIPRTSSAISFSAQQYRYQDNLVPSNTFTQLRENLDLTIKF